MKFQRQSTIVDIISHNEVKTQEELSLRLKTAGFATTQATISRDIKELRLTKVASPTGGYKYSTPEMHGNTGYMPRLRSVFRECVLKVDRAQNIVVLKTLIGMGNAACVAIDAMKVETIVGSLAGDDTIFIVFHTNDDAEEFCNTIADILN